MSKSPKFQVRKEKRERVTGGGRCGEGRAVGRFYPADFEGERWFHEPKNADVPQS